MEEKEIDIDELKTHKEFNTLVALVINSELDKLRDFCMDVFHIDKKFFSSTVKSYNSWKIKKIKANIGLH